VIKKLFEKFKERYDECVNDYELDIAFTCCELTDDDDSEDLVVCKRLCGFEIKTKIMCLFKSVFSGKIRENE